MVSVPEDLRRRLEQAGQEHVLAGWDPLGDSQREELLAQLRAVDLDLLRGLYARRDHSIGLPAPKQIRPIPVVRQADIPPECRRLGEEALERGEVAVLVVAGGQGSRLGFENPKGMFPIGPISHKSLFQVHAEKVLALGRRYGKPVPFLVMTSPATDAETQEYFGQNNHFGLAPHEVFFFEQGTMPALDLATGKLLLEAPGRLFTSPNGHGGTLLALAESGLLDRMRLRGIRQVFYFQVDNPLVKVADPIFVGYHRAIRSEASTKVVPKEGPKDKLGNLVLIDGRCSMIEYSDLPAEMAQQREADGRLRFWVGSPAIHVFDTAFLERVSRGESRIPFHVARKKVPHIDEHGNPVVPDNENALKFEMFIFDALPKADRWAVIETSRGEEFAPLKNATGADSPEAVRQAISNLAGDWLERAGVAVPRKDQGDVTVPLEISPLLGLDAEELARKVDPGLKIDGPTYLGYHW
jgi:UDP-N-acetylglucosamine/UDP-N-acetylgalactosamine diphosphorylase